jgi:hypothetical protein
VVELVDTPGLGPGVARREGSSPFSPTRRHVMEPTERLLNLRSDDVVSREEVTGGMGLILAGLIHAIEVKAEAVNAADDPDINNAIDELQERLMIIGNGLRKKPQKLYLYNSQIKKTYDSSVDAIERYANDRYRLVDMALKIGVAIHQEAAGNGLLTQKAEQRLGEIEN